MGLITVEGIRVFAYHGHLPEEKKLVTEKKTKSKK